MTEEEIQALILLDEEVLDTYLLYLSAQVQQQVELGSSLGLTTEQVVLNIEVAALTAANFETFVTTSLNDYSRAVTYGIMQEEPDDTLYWYIGPADGKTRDICLQQISAGKLTQKEIISNFGVSVLRRGGGYNCRHKWEVAGTVSEFYESKDAEKLKSEKGLEDA